MWTIAEFRPVALFSLRPANATVSGGKTLITPTPFAIKMALLDGAIRLWGRDQGAEWWPQIRDLAVAVALPDQLLVVKTFQRILRPQGLRDRLGTGLSGPWGANIVYREYVQFDTSAPMQIAIRDVHPDTSALPWIGLFSQINYFGKRGSFFQFTDAYTGDGLDDTVFTLLNEPSDGFDPRGLMQLLDDCGSEMTFAHADIYDQTHPRLKINQPDGRLLNIVVLPYAQTGAGRGFTAYQRLERM
ncbi:MAG: hypothetical protein GYB65_21525 [Chloroflexi bacterium]|nr:hypothetical protein [Chloroflexota bacterium]